MTREVDEADWKVLRQLHPIALSRLCDRILKEAAALCADTNKSQHQRYLELYALLQRRDHDVAAGFNDMRRSRMVERIMAMKRLGLLTDEELERFSLGLRRIVLVTSAHMALS